MIGAGAETVLRHGRQDRILTTVFVLMAGVYLAALMVFGLPLKTRAQQSLDATIQRELGVVVMTIKDRARSRDYPAVEQAITAG